MMDDELDEKDERIVSLERENERLKASIASLEAQVAGMVAAAGPEDGVHLRCRTPEGLDQKRCGACKWCKLHAALTDAEAAGTRVIEEATAKGWRAAHDAAVRNYGGAIAEAVRVERERIVELIQILQTECRGLDRSAVGALKELRNNLDTPPAESAEEAECSICNQVGGPLVECTVCHMPKHPRGRDPGLYASSGYCQHECPGHDQEPIPGSLWPNERYGDSLGHMDWHEEADTP